MTSAVLEVCAAVVLKDDSLLLATRKPGAHLAGKWEFPGGKVRSGETLEACIQRELEEELSLSVEDSVEIFQLLFVYPEKTVHLHFMYCMVEEETEVQPMEGQNAGWFQASELNGLELAPADAQALERMRESALANNAVKGILNQESCGRWMAFLRTWNGGH